MPAHTDFVRADLFKIVAPVEKLLVECGCGCGALTDVDFKGTLWVAAGDDVLFLGVRKGVQSWMLRVMIALRGGPLGLIRIVVLKNGARLVPLAARRPLRMCRPPRGAQWMTPQRVMDSAAGFRLMQPPADVSPVGYSGPLVPADPPFVPAIQLFYFLPGPWKLAD